MTAQSLPLARWKDLCLDAHDQAAQGEFWAAVLGLNVESSPGKVSLEGASAHERIWINAVDRVSTGLDHQSSTGLDHQSKRNRLHLDIYAASVGDLEALGAAVVERAEDTGFAWTTMLDPEGGEFCCFVRDGGPGDPEAPGARGDELPAYRLHGIGIDSADPAAQAAWWGRAFGVEPITFEGHDDWYTLEHATPDPVLTLDFAEVPEPRVGPNRVHWDVTGDVEELLAAGATRLWETDGWTVLADPEGNEFCVFPAVTR